MDYRPRSSRYYGPNGYGGGRGNGGYGGGYGNGAYTGSEVDTGTAATPADVATGGSARAGGGSAQRCPWLRRGRRHGRRAPAAGGGDAVDEPRPWPGLGRAGEEFLPGLWACKATILPEAMRAAEVAAGEVLLGLHPTEAAERRRHEVIDYAKRLIGTTFGCEVYAFGSVPLKTYLPDGDVDLTILTNTPLDTPVDSGFIDEVYCLLSSEAKNEVAQFTIKEIKIINAKVKLIKCVIDNIVVDISFNQIGGLSKLCFIELVDSEIENDHLLKKSIILIKAWCYHEGKIHGSSVGLISTYALEILIIYVFKTFHNSLHGPLEALYMFLEYYSKFDWNKYFLTLNGPLPKPTRSKVTVEPVSLNDESLLSNESLNGSLDRHIVPRGSSHRQGGKFCWKDMNIIDPLTLHNNLGNSISPDNSERIKDAFKCGALRLGQILNLSSEHIHEAIFYFFTSTLGRHGGGERHNLGYCVLFHSMPDSGNGHGDHVFSLDNSYADKDENKSPGSSLELSNKESDVKISMHQSSGLTNLRSHSSSSSENGNRTNIDMSRHILTSSTQANSLDVSGSYPIVESNWTDVRQEKCRLPPFSPSNLLDLSGDLGLHLECLRCVQYNLEALLDKFLETVKETSLAGVLDEDCFRSSTLGLLSNTDARTPRLSVALSTDTDGRNLSRVSCPQGTGDVPQRSINEAQVDALNHLFPATHILPSGLSFYPSNDANSEVYHDPWYQNTEDVPQTYGAGMYMADMNFPLPPITDTLSNGLPFYQENHTFYSPYMPGDTRKTRGTGTYIPRPVRNLEAHEIGKEKSWSDKKQRQKQQDQFYAEKKLDRVQSCNRSAPIESATREPRTTTTENSLQRYENGSMETPPLSPPRIVLPHHGGGGQGNLPVPSTGQPSPPAVTMVTPAVTMVNSQSITSVKHENLEFGTMGPFSANLLTTKFMEDFPPLSGTKKPVQAAPALAVKSPKPGASAAKSWPVEAKCSTVQSPRAGVSVTQSRPKEAPASTAQSPKPSASAAQFRPEEESYQLKDDAHFPPLQAGTCYNADFPPLRAAPR